MVPAQEELRVGSGEIAPSAIAVGCANDCDAGVCR